MNKLYRYVDKNAESWAKKYDPFLSDVNAAVFFIEDNYDAAQLKIELNHIVAKGYKLFCVMRGNPQFDSGINLQMGLAVRLTDSDDAPEELAGLLEKESPKKSSKGIIIALAIAIAVIAVLTIVLKPANEEPVLNADNLSLSEVYTNALIDAGADSIIVDGGISKEEMLLVETLDLSGLGIDNLQPLLYATNLRELNLSGNKITDITNLAALAKLEKLDLSGNPVEDYGVLDYLPKLTEIIK